MADYKQTEGSATTWRRASIININNHLNETPNIRFQEDDVVTIGDKQFISAAVSSIQATFDPAAEIPLINPFTGESAGTTTQGELQVILYSLYLQLAEARDNPPAPAPNPAPDPAPETDPTPVV